jgi:hypothetical protein
VRENNEGFDVGVIFFTFYYYYFYFFLFFFLEDFSIYQMIFCYQLTYDNANSSITIILIIFILIPIFDLSNKDDFLDVDNLINWFICPKNQTYNWVSIDQILSMR